MPQGTHGTAHHVVSGRSGVFRSEEQLVRLLAELRGSRRGRRCRPGADSGPGPSPYRRSHPRHARHNPSSTRTPEGALTVHAHRSPTLSPRASARSAASASSPSRCSPARPAPSARPRVTPTPVNDGNPTCADFDASWTQLKVEGGALGNGTFTDGTLEVTISNFQNSNSGNPGSFDWSSNIGVDAVFVKAGNDKHNLFVYDPESTGDTDLGPAGRPRQRHQPHLVLLRRGRRAAASAGRPRAAGRRAARGRAAGRRAPGRRAEHARGSRADADPRARSRV